jgi:hypothetical protein
MKKVRLDLIRLDGGTQFRDQINQDVVKDYAEKMGDGAEFPAICCTFDGTTYWLYDGFHRYFAQHNLGYTEIQVHYLPGTLEDAQDLALSANSKNGLHRNNATKRKVVETALSMERHKNKSNREIAKLCEVSHSFVAAIRNPEAKKQQSANVKKHFEKKAKEESGVKLHPEAKPLEVNPNRPSMLEDFAPSEQEIQESESFIESQNQLMVELLDSDDKLATAYDKIKVLTLENEHQRITINRLMNTNKELEKLVLSLQRQVDKAKK